MCMLGGPESYMSQLDLVAHKLLHPRAYPRGFAKALVDLYEDHGGQPRLDVRFRRPAQDGVTDRELFEGMASNDSWLDGRLPEVAFYLASSKHLKVPDTWHDCIAAYLKQLREQAPRLNCIVRGVEFAHTCLKWTQVCVDQSTLEELAPVS